MGVKELFLLSSEKCNEIQWMESGARHIQIGNMTYILNGECA